MARGAPATGRGVAKVDRAAAMGASVAGCAGCEGCEAVLASAPSARRQGAPHSPRDDSEGGASPQPGVVSEAERGEAAVCSITGATGVPGFQGGRARGVEASVLVPPRCLLCICPALRQPRRIIS
jgi:hypothetical protein